MRYQYIILVLAMFSVAMPLTGCEDDKNPSLDKKKPVDNPDMHQDKEHKTDKAVENNAKKPSSFQGTWLVNKDDADETPVVRVSIIQNEGDDTGFGDFYAQAALGEIYEGESGDLMGMESTADGFSFTFNPTTDLTEEYSVKTQKKIDDNTYEGTFISKVDATFTFKVKISKSQF